MKYKLSRKNENGKWWTYGQFETNQWGNLQASFKIENLEKAIEIAKNDPKCKGWINFSAFEDDSNRSGKPNSSKPQAGTSPYADELNDSIPFTPYMGV